MKKFEFGKNSDLTLMWSFGTKNVRFDYLPKVEKKTRDFTLGKFKNLVQKIENFEKSNLWKIQI